MIARVPVFARLATAFACATLAGPAAAQGWDMVDAEGRGGAGAYVCPLDDAETGNFLCFHLGCTDTDPLRFEISYAGGALVDRLGAMIAVDGRAAGMLKFAREDNPDFVALSAPFDPRQHRDLVARLREGVAATITLDFPDAPEVVDMSLRGSSRTLGAVLQTCPMPEVPLDDPAALVLDQIVTECAALGGTIGMEDGFERREDLDGDGREDVVIDFAAAVCSEMASLYCGSGGCTVGFFLARGDAYKRLFDGVIRGYSVQPGGRLALDLHGSACGLYGFEACRKVFDITGDNFTLIEELAGAAAEAAMAADEASVAAEPPAAPPPVDDGDGAQDVPPGEEAAPEDEAPAPDAADTQEAPPAPDTAPTPEPATEPAPEPAPSGLEWLGDGGPAVVPQAGETLPDDLVPDPIGTAPAENPGTGR